MHKRKKNHFLGHSSTEHITHTKHSAQLTYCDTNSMSGRRKMAVGTKPAKVCITEHNTGNVRMLKKEQVDEANKEIQNIINGHPNQVYIPEKEKDDVAENTTTTSENKESTEAADTTTVSVIDNTIESFDEKSEKPQVCCSHTHAFLLNECSSYKGFYHLKRVSTPPPITPPLNDTSPPITPPLNDVDKYTYEEEVKQPVSGGINADEAVPTDDVLPAVVLTQDELLQYGKVSSAFLGHISIASIPLSRIVQYGMSTHKQHTFLHT